MNPYNPFGTVPQLRIAEVRVSCDSSEIQLALMVGILVIQSVYTISADCQVLVGVYLMSKGGFNSDEFLERLRNREGEAWNEFCQGMWELLFEGIFHALGRDANRREDAEDLVQKTLIRAYEKIDSFEGNSKIETWLRMIARRFIADYFEEKSVSPHFTVVDIRDAAALAVKLREARDPLSEYLIRGFSIDAKRLLENFDGSSSQTKEIQKVLAREFDRALGDPLLFDKRRFAHITMSEETQRLIEQSPHPKVWERIRRNRLLLEDAYLGEIKRSRERHVETVNISELKDDFLIEKILGSEGRPRIVDQCEKKELLEMIESAINDFLPQEERYLLILRYVYELTESEIAKVWRYPRTVPKSTVTVTLMRVKDKLRKIVLLKLGIFRGIHITRHANELGSSLIVPERLNGAVVVKKVDAGSAGAEAAIKEGDKITGVGNKLVHDVKEFIAWLLRHVKASSDVALSVERGNKKMKIIVPGEARNGRGRG